MIIHLDEVIPRLRAWVKTKPCIGELVIFGSYAKGCPTPTSDLDVAVRVARPLDGDTNVYTTLISEADRWQSELSALVGIPVHLEDMTDEPVRQYVREVSIPVYREAAGL